MDETGEASDPNPTSRATGSDPRLRAKALGHDPAGERMALRNSITVAQLCEEYQQEIMVNRQGR